MTTLILRDSQLERVEFTPELDAVLEAALEKAAPITRVTNAEKHAESVAAQAALGAVIRQTEKAGKEFRSVFEAYQRLELKCEREKLAEACAESLRLKNLDIDYYEEQKTLARNAELLRVAELQRIQREQQAALAVAETPNQREAVQEHFKEQVQAVAEAPPPALPKTAGQIIADVWEYEVTDMKVLAATHWTCVKVEDRRREILAMLSAGQTLQGIRAWKKPNATLTGRTPQQKAIEV